MSISDHRQKVRQLQEQIVRVTQELLKEAGSPELAQKVAVHSSFEEDLGLASFDLVELLIRVEGAVGVKLPDHIAEQAGTPAEWAKVIAASAEFDSAERAAQEQATHRSAPPPPLDARDLVEVLMLHAEIEPDRVHARFPHAKSRQLTFSELLQQASLFAGALVEHGFECGDRVGLLLENHPDFPIAFFGVQMAGCIPLVLFPPEADGATGEYLRTQCRILEEAESRLLIASREFSATTRLFKRNVVSLREVLRVPQLLKGARPLARTVAVAATAAILISAGVEGAPRAVPLSHSDILASLRALSAPLGLTPHEVVVNWLPMASVLGLVNGWLFSLYYAFPVTILNPRLVQRTPDLWLLAIDQTRATISLATDSGYDLCARKAPAGALEGLDLSHWRVALNSGEPVRAKTLQLFADRFQPFGLSPAVQIPAFSLVETAGIALLAPASRLPLIDRADRNRFESRGEIRLAADDGQCLSFVSVGGPLSDFEVNVLDQTGQAVPEGTVGRLFFRRLSRPSFSNHYWVDAADWQDSGDLAYFAGGEIRIVGRAADLLKHGDRYMLPELIEEAVEQVPGVYPARTAAFRLDSNRGTESLAIVAETTALKQADVQSVRARIRKAVEQLLGLAPATVELVRSGQMPRSGLGRVRRARTRDLLLKGRLGEGTMLGRLAWWQLRLEAVGRGFLKAVLRIGRLTRNVYHRCLLTLLPLLGGLLIRSLGDRRLASRVLRSTARTMLAAAGHKVPPTQFFELRHPGAQLFVANRSGKYDPLLLAATLPADLVFADPSLIHGFPKAVQFLLRPLVLERPAQNAGGATHTESISEAIRDGCSVVVFPESAPGTAAAACRYRLDAFGAALASRVPVTPIALRATAGVFEPGSRGAPEEMNMVVGDLVHPETYSAASASDFRARARVAVANLVEVAPQRGEPSPQHSAAVA